MDRDVRVDYASYQINFSSDPNVNDNWIKGAYGRARRDVDFVKDAAVLVFKPRQTVIDDVWMDTIDDDHDEGDEGDEGDEAFIVQLSNPRSSGKLPVTLADPEGVAIIENSDPMPSTWLTRFGRAVAQQAADGVTARFEARRAPVFEGRFGGASFGAGGGRGDGAEAAGCCDGSMGGSLDGTLDGGLDDGRLGAGDSRDDASPGGCGGRGLGVAPHAGPDGTFGAGPQGMAGIPGVGTRGMSETSNVGMAGPPGNGGASTVGRSFGTMHAGAGGGLGGSPGLGGGARGGDSGYGGAGYGGRGYGGHSPTIADLLLGSAFTWTGGEDAGGGSLAAWGSGSRSSFTGSEGNLRVDGAVTTALLGVDYARGDWLAGVALLSSTGKGGYGGGASGNAAAAGLHGGAAFGGANPGGPAFGGAAFGAEAFGSEADERSGPSVEATLTAAIPYGRWRFRAPGRLGRARPRRRGCRPRHRRRRAHRGGHELVDGGGGRARRPVRRWRWCPTRSGPAPRPTPPKAWWRPRATSAACASASRRAGRSNGPGSAASRRSWSSAPATTAATPRPGSGWRSAAAWPGRIRVWALSSISPVAP